MILSIISVFGICVLPLGDQILFVLQLRELFLSITKMIAESNFVTTHSSSGSFAFAHIKHKLRIFMRTLLCLISHGKCYWRWKLWYFIKLRSWKFNTPRVKLRGHFRKYKITIHHCYSYFYVSNYSLTWLSNILLI